MSEPMIANPDCEGAREEVVRAYLKDPPGWKERCGLWVEVGGRERCKRIFDWIQAAFWRGTPGEMV